MNESNENLVLQAVVENPRASLHEIENNVGVARSSAGAVLKRFKYHSYLEQPCQGLCQGNRAKVIKFCRLVPSDNAIQIQISPKNFYCLMIPESQIVGCLKLQLSLLGPKSAFASGRGTAGGMGI